MNWTVGNKKWSPCLVLASRSTIFCFVKGQIFQKWPFLVWISDARIQKRRYKTDQVTSLSSQKTQKKLSKHLGLLNIFKTHHTYWTWPQIFLHIIWFIIAQLNYWTFALVGAFRSCFAKVCTEPGVQRKLCPGFSRLNIIQDYQPCPLS